MLPTFLPIHFTNENDRLKILNNLKNYRNGTFILWCSRNGISIEKENGRWLIKNVDLAYNPLDSTDLISAEITRDELEYMIQNPDCVLMIIPPHPNDNEDIAYAVPFLPINEVTLH